MQIGHACRIPDRFILGAKRGGLGDMEEVRAAVRDFEEAIQEVNMELERMSRNIRDMNQYQAHVFQVTKVLCSWMENIEGLALQRTQLPSTPAHDLDVN